MKKAHNSKQYAIANTGLTPDSTTKATRKLKKKRTIAKEKKLNGSKSNT